MEFYVGSDDDDDESGDCGDFSEVGDGFKLDDEIFLFIGVVVGNEIYVFDE